MSATKMSAGQVFDRLAAGPFAPPAHVMLAEVKNATGWSRVDRWADALVVSVYPSRGIWFAGVEIKVSRSDWKRELADPTKSEAIQKFCNYWWIAAPEGVVELAEVPEAWGLIEITDKKCKKTKDAPRLSPEPLSPTFVASILRNASNREDRAFGRGCDQTRRELQERFAKLIDAEQELAELRLKAIEQERLDDDLKQLREAVLVFERETGLRVSPDRWGQPQDTEQLGKLVRAARMVGDLARLPGQLRAAAQQIEEAQAAIAPSAEQKSA